MSVINKVPRKLPDGSEVMLPENMSQEEVFRLGREKGLIKKGALTANPSWIGSWDTTPPPPEPSAPTPESYADFVPQFPGDVPESIQPTESVTGNTFRQNVEENGATLGGIAGTVAGIPLGPVGMIAGGSIGSGLGSLGSDALKGEDLDVFDALKESAISLGIDFATLGVGKLGKAAYSGIRELMKKGVSPDDIVRKMAKGTSADVGTPQAMAQSQEILMKEGLSLTPYATGVASKWDITKEGIARTGFLSKDVFTTAIDKTKEVVRNRMRDIMNMNNSGATATTQEDVGRGMVEAFKAGQKVLQDNYGTGLSEISEVVSKSSFNFDGSLKRAMTKFKNANVDSSPNKNSTLDEKTLEAISKLEGLMKGVSSGSGKFLLEFETALNKQINAVSDFGPNFNKNTARELTELSKSVRGSIRNQLRKIDPVAARKFRNLNRTYAEGTNTIYPEINSTFITNAGKGAYSALGRMFTLPGSVDNVSNVMKSLDRAYQDLSPAQLAKLPFKDLASAKQAIARSYIEKALPGAGSASFSIKDFTTVAKDLKNPTEASRVKSILGSSYEAYKRTVNLMSMAAEKPESGLATLFQRSKEFAATGGVVAALATGAFNVATATASAATILLGPRVLARIATSPKHVNQLIKLDKMGGKAVSYEDLAYKASLLLNDIADEAYEAGDIDFIREIGLLGDYE